MACPPVGFGYIARRELFGVATFILIGVALIALAPANYETAKREGIGGCVVAQSLFLPATQRLRPALICASRVRPPTPLNR
jgi:hypothetical protein